MGAGRSPAAPQSPEDVMAAYTRYIPAMLQATVGTENTLLQPGGAGNTAANAAADLNMRLNPAYAGARELINSYNLTGLSPGEASAVERGLNQTNTGTGNLGLVNPMNTVTNAMNFGGAFNNKLTQFANAVNTATGAMGTFNPTGVATGQPVANFGSSMLGNQTSMANSLTAANTSLQNTNSIPAYLGATCCFIFLQAYKGKLPKCVRKGRDRYYKVNIDIASGYRRMASWLVPLMEASPVINELVWKVMVKPITEHLHHPKKGWRKSLTHFWLKTWAILGKGHWESEYNNLIIYV